MPATTPTFASRPTAPSLTRSRLRHALVVLPLVAALAACGKSGAPAAPGGAPAGGMPAPEVGVVTVTPGDVGLQTELPGRLEASRVAQARAAT